MIDTEPDHVARERTEALEALVYGRSTPGLPDLDEELAPLRPGGPRSEPRPVDIAVESARLVPGGSFVLDHPDTVPAVWGRGDHVLWASGESVEIVGPSGVGKTTLVAQLVGGRIGTHPELLGYPIEPGRRVLYLASDRPQQIARAMRRLFREDQRELLDDRLVVWKGPPPADLAAQPQLLAQLAHTAEADTVILDSLKDMAVGLSDDAVGAGLNRAIQRTLVDGIEVAALHHQRKGQNGTRPKALEDVYGSTWITAGAGSVLLLWGAPGDLVVELVHLKQPAAEVGPLKVEHDHVAGITTVSRGFELVAFLRGHPSGVTAAEVARAWFEQDVDDNRRKKAQRALDALVATGAVHKSEPSLGGSGGSTGARYRLADPAREAS